MSLRPLTFDAETFYTNKADGAYSLTWMTAEEYIRDPRFDLIGFSLKKGPGQSQWYSGDLTYLRSVAQSIPWHQVLVIGHNLSEFDALILTEVLGVKPAAYACTLQMARTLHGGKQSNSLAKLAELYGLQAKGHQVANYINKRRLDFTPWQLQDYGNYCNNDNDICWQLFNLFVPQLPPNELWINSLATKMWAEPRLALDLPLLHAMAGDMAVRKGKLLHRVADILGVSAHDEAERMATVQSLLRKDTVLASVLKNQYDIDAPMKPSPKKRDAKGNPIWTYAFAKTDEGMTALLEFEDASDPEGAEDIQSLASARISVKSTLAESRVNRFIGIGERGLLPVPLRSGATHTHRLAGCLVADTVVTCYDPLQGVCSKRIVDVQGEDLVWDGEDFVRHDGVQYQGMAEVIEHDGIRGTTCHPVFVEPGSDRTISLAEAKRTGARIVACPEPEGWTADDIERAARLSNQFVPLSMRLRN
jgi:hypothetical protein